MMPSKKKKYNSRFPPARIKKIMQSDEEVGKVASAVPVIISRSLEMFVETLLKKATVVTSQRGARTLTPSHLKFCIESEKRFDFLKDLVASVPELHGEYDEPNTDQQCPNASQPDSFCPTGPSRTTQIPPSVTFSRPRTEPADGPRPKKQRRLKSQRKTYLDIDDYDDDLSADVPDEQSLEPGDMSAGFTPPVEPSKSTSHLSKSTNGGPPKTDVAAAPTSSNWSAVDEDYDGV